MANPGHDRGILVIISSPSGAGKTTLSRRLLAEFEGQLEFSVSYTTRPRRKGEEEGVDYHFVNDATFDEMIERGEFAEWAEVHGNRYGTSRAVVERALRGGRDVVFDVDWQGGRRLKAQWPEDSLMIFILPPSLAALEQRLRRRATDDEEVIARRVAKAIEELRHHTEYKYLVTNDDLEDAYGSLRAVYLARRLGPEAPAEIVERVEQARGPEAVRHAERLVDAGDTSAR